MNYASSIHRDITAEDNSELAGQFSHGRPENDHSWNLWKRAMQVVRVIPLFTSLLVGLTDSNNPIQAADGRNPSTYRDIDYSMSSQDARTIRVLEAITAFWFLSIGCCVGSFLNVVVYRAPLGLDIVLPKSRCPKCQHAISPTDNVPVIGWLRLRGKCRNCQSSISTRYPLVELGIGLLLLTFMFRTLLSGGANLPVRATNTYRGVIWILWYTKWDLLGIYLYQMFLLVNLWGGALMEYDGHLWPKRIVTGVATAGVLAVGLWPHLHPIPVLGPSTSRTEPWPGMGVLSGAAGLVAATGAAYTISLLVWARSPGSSLNVDSRGPVINPANAREMETSWSHSQIQYVLTAGLVGLYLGWQTGLAVTFATGVILATHASLRRHPVAMTSGLATLLLLVWRPAFDFTWPRVSLFFSHS